MDREMGENEERWTGEGKERRGGPGGCVETSFYHGLRR